MPLGLMPGMSYEEKEATLEPGDSVLLHSDGIVEAHDPERGMYGFPRLKETVGRAPDGEDLIRFVLADLESFTGAGAEQEDDITMVALSRAGAATQAAGSSGSVLGEFRLPSEEGGEREAVHLVAGAVEGLGLEPARVDRLGTAVAEATMNAMEHGNGYRRDLPVTIRVLRLPGSVRVQVTDAGGGGELPAREAPDLEAKLEGRQKPRGWGLFLIESLVDDARVTSDEEGNTLELTMRTEGVGDGDE